MKIDVKNEWLDIVRQLTIDFECTDSEVISYALTTLLYLKIFHNSGGKIILLTQDKELLEFQLKKPNKD